MPTRLNGRPRSPISSPSPSSSLLEGLLSADNALVLAILVLGLPRDQQQKALRYGILGAFVFRILATLLAVHLLALPGSSSSARSTCCTCRTQHFFGGDSGGAEERRAIKPAMPWLGLTRVLGDGRQGRADRHRLLPSIRSSSRSRCRTRRG